MLHNDKRRKRKSLEVIITDLRKKIIRSDKSQLGTHGRQKMDLDESLNALQKNLIDLE
jgi:hypothetical protein